MDACVIQHRLALGNAQEARALLVGLRAKLWHLEQLLAGCENAVFLPEGDHVLCGGGIQPGHPQQKRGRGGVQVDAHGVDAVFHHGGKGFVQPFLGHVMLVLPHADGLGIDLHKLGQRILHPAGNGYGGAQVDIILGKLFRRKL